MRTSVTLLGAALAAASSAACSRGFGSGFEGEVTVRSTLPKGPATTTVFKAKGDRIRIEIAGPDGKVTASAIFLPNENKVFALADDRKAVTELDIGSPIAPVSDLDSRRSTAWDTGKHETIAGIECEDYAVDNPSGAHAKVCVAQGLPYLDLGEIRRGRISQWGRDMRAKRTFPLRSVEYDARDNEVSRAEVVDVKKEKLDDALFQVPAGYTPTR